MFFLFFSFLATGVVAAARVVGVAAAGLGALTLGVGAWLSAYSTTVIAKLTGAGAGAGALTGGASSSSSLSLELLDELLELDEEAAALAALMAASVWIAEGS